VMVTWVSAIADALLGARLVSGWLRWRSGYRGGLTSWLAWVSVGGGGEQRAGDVQAQEQADQGGDQAAASPHGVLLLVVPAGRAQVLARPGRPGLPGPPGRRPGQGPPQAVPKGRGACGAPLTRTAARWQPVQQATGRSVRGRRVPARGAAGEAGPCPGHRGGRGSCCRWAGGGQDWPRMGRVRAVGHRRPRPGRGRTGSHSRRAGEGSRPVRSRRPPIRWPTRRTIRPARATAAAIPTGAGSWVGNGMVLSGSRRVAMGSIGSGAMAGGASTRKWMDWPAWMTQASPGWAWRTCSGSMRGRSPMRALASPRGP